MYFLMSLLIFELKITLAFWRSSERQKQAFGDQKCFLGSQNNFQTIYVGENKYNCATSQAQGGAFLVCFELNVTPFTSLYTVMECQKGITSNKLYVYSICSGDTHISQKAKNIIHLKNFAANTGSDLGVGKRIMRYALFHLLLPAILRFWHQP